MSHLDWYVGMEVVCVQLDDDCPPRPALNEVCTVSFIYEVDGYTMIDLVEYPSPDTDDFYRGYEASYFRPVQPRQTDISCFTQMLNPSKVNVGEPA
ncbi:hypothetical protein ACHMW4_04210 [Mesorhizobium sp. UC22_110]|uniref:hypothetical protein n=1 Tax=unclassified Mesorhizobium TaxID=325217 RepID=UPI00366C6D26